jgi:hypothetical protein
MNWNTPESPTSTFFRTAERRSRNFVRFYAERFYQRTSKSLRTARFVTATLDCNSDSCKRTLFYLLIRNRNQAKPPFVAFSSVSLRFTIQYNPPHFLIF